MQYKSSGGQLLIYSAQHIKNLTVQAALSLRLPEICSKKFKVFEWSQEVPAEDIFTLEMRCYAPSIPDIHPILIDGILQYANGMCSVQVTFCGKPSLYCHLVLYSHYVGVNYLVHLWDVCRWSNFNHLHLCINHAKLVLSTV